jgi:hypothetical protein
MRHALANPDVPGASRDDAKPTQVIGRLYFEVAVGCRWKRASSSATMLAGCGRGHTGARSVDRSQGQLGTQHASPRPEIGAVSGPSSARGAMFRSVLASRASEGQGGGSAQGLNRMGGGIGGDQVLLESIERPGRCSGRRSGGQTSMGEDPGNHVPRMQR